MEMHPYPGQLASVLSPGSGVNIALLFLTSSIPNIEWNLTLFVTLVIPLETQSMPVT